MNETTRVIIVRHGETVGNLAGRWQGHWDSPLTETGIAQAEAVARRLESADFSALLSSDLGRALHTAKIISKRTGHDVVPDERLRERRFGIFEGLTRAEMAAKYPDEWRQYEAAGPDYVIPGGESARQRFERACACLRDIALARAGETVVIVTHGGVLFSLLRRAVGIPLGAPRRFLANNASINVFLYRNGKWVLETWGDVCHLDRLSSLDDT